MGDLTARGEGITTSPTDATATPLTLEAIQDAIRALRDDYTRRVDVWEHQGSYGGIDIWWNPRLGCYMTADPAHRKEIENYGSDR